MTTTWPTHTPRTPVIVLTDVNPQVDPTHDIVCAYRQVRTSAGAARLSALRQALPHIDRGVLDAVLIAWHKADLAVLMSDDDRLRLTSDDRAAAIAHHGNQFWHLVVIRGI